MNDRTLLRTGIIGGIVAAVCCATPLLALAFAALGLSAWLAWADYVLLPLIALCLALVALALWRLRNAPARSATSNTALPNQPLHTKDHQ